MKVLGSTDGVPLDPELRSLFEEGLDLFRAGDDRRAHELAGELLDLEPEHAGGMMLLLATAGSGGGGGGEAAIISALRRLSLHYDRLLAIPEVVLLLDSDLFAPVVQSRSFQDAFGPELREIQRRTRDDDAARAVAGRLLDTLRDVAVEQALEAAPVFRPSRERSPMQRVQLVEVESGMPVATLGRGQLYVGGRAPEADILFTNPTVSRLHFSISLEDGAWTLQNLSQNGTQLNGGAVGQGGAILQDGDELRVGEMRLDVLDAAAADAGDDASMPWRGTPSGALAGDLAAASISRPTPVPGFLRPVTVPGSPALLPRSRN